MSQKLGSSLLRQASDRQISSLRWVPGAAFWNPWKPDLPCLSGFLPHDLVTGGISCAGSGQVTKVSIISGTSWCPVPPDVIHWEHSLSSTPAQNVCLDLRKHQMAQVEGHTTKYYRLVLFKTVKVTKDKEGVRKWSSRLKQIKDIWQGIVMYDYGFEFRPRKEKETLGSRWNLNRIHG